MADILIPSLSVGLDALTAITRLAPPAAADGSYNLFYEKDKAATIPGLSSFHTSSPLNSGDSILLTFTARIGGSDYILAVTREKIFRYNVVTEVWDNITQATVTMGSDVDSPVSAVVISHDDTNIYYNDDATQANAYEHVVICDGGLSNIQRWAGQGETDCADLSGSSGYSGAGPHRALQVGGFQNRLLLISPLEYDTASKVWVENNVRVRWPTIGKLQTWTGTGSGAADLRDLGGVNIWSAPLGGEYYIYQTNSIWNLRYVAGTAIFDPRPVITNLGLLSNKLLTAHGNIHYFVGRDYNVYAYLGGSQKLAIGDKIRDWLYRDIESGYLRRCWIALDVNAEHLWIFIVPAGGTYATKAYVYSLKAQTWLQVDLSAKFTATSGITSVATMAATTAESGDTYNHALGILSAYDVSDAADATQRYADVLLDSSRAWTSDITNATWCAGGTYLTCATATFLQDATVNDIVMVQDGSNYTNCRFGTHFYTISALNNTSITFTQRDASLAVSDTTLKPADVSFTVWDPTGSLYADEIEIVKTANVLTVGTNDGYIYQFESTLSGDLAGTDMPSRHYTPIFDGGMPGRMKRWPGLRVTARQPTTAQPGQINVYYRTSGFDGTGNWNRIDSTWTVDGTWATKHFFINRTATQIQFALMDSSGSAYEVREIEIMEPQIQENR